MCASAAAAAAGNCSASKNTRTHARTHAHTQAQTGGYGTFRAVSLMAVLERFVYSAAWMPRALFD